MKPRRRQLKFISRIFKIDIQSRDPRRDVAVIQSGIETVMTVLLFKVSIREGKPHRSTRLPARP